MAPKPARLCAVAAAAGAWAAAAVPSALAHGTASGNTEGAFTPLIFVVAIIGLVLFLVFTHNRKGWNVLVVGGAGYVGSALVPALLERKHRVTVLDLYSEGGESLDAVRNYADFREVKGDLAEPRVLNDALEGCDAVINLAPAAAENPSGRDADRGGGDSPAAFRALVRVAKRAGVKRFVHASTFAVYGDTAGNEAAEDAPTAPGDPAASRAVHCENVLEEERAPGFVACTLRPAAVCGPAPGQGLGSPVNRFTFDAVTRGRIEVRGGDRQLPSIHVDDLVRLFLAILGSPGGRIDGKVFNAVAENHTLSALALIVKEGVGGDVEIAESPGDGAASCALSGVRLHRELGFQPRRGVADAVRDLATTFPGTAVADSAEDASYAASR